ISVSIVKIDSDQRGMILGDFAKIIAVPDFKSIILEGPGKINYIAARCDLFIRLALREAPSCRKNAAGHHRENMAIHSETPISFVNFAEAVFNCLTSSTVGT